MQKIVGERKLVFTRFFQQEILQGSRDEAEWTLIQDHLAEQTYLEAREGTWVGAARIYFDLRRKGRTVRSSVDCCIAQLVIENDALLLHDDRDFEVIADVRPLRQQRFRVDPPTQG